jgi:hypothetical protein
VSESDILRVQAMAVEADDFALLCVSWTALGYARRYAFVPVTDDERARAVEACAAVLRARTPPCVGDV